MSNFNNFANDVKNNETVEAVVAAAGKYGPQALWLAFKLAVFLGSIGFVAWALWKLPMLELLEVFIVFFMIPLLFLVAVGVIQLGTLQGIYGAMKMGAKSFRFLVKEAGDWHEDQTRKAQKRAQNR